jgi:hypothetical protein
MKSKTVQHVLTRQSHRDAGFRHSNFLMPCADQEKEEGTPSPENDRRDSVSQGSQPKRPIWAMRQK